MSPDPVVVPRLLDVIAAWSWRLLVGVAALAALFFALTQLFVVVVPVLLALFIAAALEPAVAWLRGRGLRPLLAAWIVFTGALVVVVGIMSWIGTSVAGQFDQVGEELEQAVIEVKDWAQGAPLNLSAAQVERIEDDVRSAVRQSGSGVARQAAGQARTATEFLGGFVLLLFTLFFVLKDGERIGAWLNERVPRGYTEDAAAIASRVRYVMRKYLAATALTGVIDGIFIGVGLAIIGVPLALPLGVLTFFGGFFPIVGATVAGLVAAMVALVTVGFAKALIVVGLTVAVQQIEGNVLQPLILERAVRLHALVTVWAVAAGVLVGGILGAFLAVPIVAALSAIGGYYRQRNEPAAVA